MPWILHLSDPHLGDVSPGQELDDEKVLLERQRDRETTQRVFLRTLGALKWFVEANGRPDATIISGDLTHKARKAGFDAFVTMLNEHADVFPEKKQRIVVVPGNHDGHSPARAAATMIHAAAPRTRCRQVSVRPRSPQLAHSRPMPMGANATWVAQAVSRR
jgi:3',5'-cyclic AMP phosphodiesterase CpdA